MDVTPNTVAFVQLVLTPYNYTLYQRLSARLRDHVCFVVGDRFFRGTSGQAGRVSISTDGLWRSDVTNTYAGNQLVWQGPLPELVFDSAIAVLELNPRIVSNWYVAWRRGRRGLATIWWGHGLSRRKSAGALARAACRLIVRRADAVVLYDQRSKRDLIELGADPEKLFVAPNSIDVDVVGRLAREHPPAERHNILFIGRLIEDKKITLLLEAFAIALGELPPATALIVVGDGPERGRLQEAAHALGIAERVHFLGEVSDEAHLAPIFATSVLVAHPSAIGLAAVHGLAYGLPVLFADNEEHGPEVDVLIPGENSETFHSGDPYDLAHRLIDMTARPADMKRMGQAGMVAMQQAFGVERMADVFERAFSYAVSVCRRQ